jgi:hypothetical protein
MQKFGNWRLEFRKISGSTEVHGLERYACIVFHFLRIFSASYWLIDTSKSIELYVVSKALVLLILLTLLPHDFLIAALPIASYLLFELYVVQFTILLLRKVESTAPPVSVERSLLLFIFNVAEVILAFAIFYRLVLDCPVTEAIVVSILVLGTVGYPAGAASIVSVQIVLDFLLLAIFLAALVGRVGAFEKNSD